MSEREERQNTIQHYITNSGQSQTFDAGNFGQSAVKGLQAINPVISFHQLVNDVCKHHPNNTAVIFNGDKITYAQLKAKSDAVACRLVQAGVKKGATVALILERSANLPVALLGILKAGAVYLPVDPAFPNDRILFMLTDSDVKFILTSEVQQGRFGQDIQELMLDTSTVNDVSPLETIIVTSNDIAYVLYTSGSTGKPKGVLITHKNLVNLLLAMKVFPGINQADRLLAVTTVSFDIAGLELFLPLTIGATVIIADYETTRDGRALLKLIQETGITIMQATPATWKLIIASGWSKKIALKILCCGEPLPRDLAEKLLDRCTSLWNMYGPTETTIYSTGKQILKTDNVITIGVPISNTAVYILDSNQQLVEKGETGEIYISGDGVAAGYRNREALNAEKFLPDPFKVDGALMYRTGDLGQLTDSGEILCIGRIDQQVKIRGYRIEPGEIEYQLKKNNWIKEAVVATRVEKGDEVKLVAYLMPGSQLDRAAFKELASALKDELRRSLPVYMVPSEFHLLTELPLTLNGKIDYKALIAAVDTSAESPATTINRSQMENLLYKIWAEALEITNFTVDDNFFDIGGHSLIAVFVMSEIEKKTGKSLPISTFYEYTTIRKLASLLQTDLEGSLWNSLVPIKPSGNKTPLYLIHGDGLNVLVFKALAEHLDEDQPVFGLQAIGLNSKDTQVGTMEQIAARYAKEIMAQNPEGPYAIAGYSYGGNIGVEIARILKSQGKEVKMLALFDANAQNSEKHRAMLPKLFDKVLRQFPKTIWILRSFLKNPRNAAVYQFYFLKTRFKAIANKLGLYQKPEPQGMFKQIEVVQDKYQYAYENYRLKPYKGPIHLFKAKQRIYFVEDVEYLGWDSYALGGIKVYTVPGDHQTMLQPPHASKLASKLQRVLNSA